MTFSRTHGYKKSKPIQHESMDRNLSTKIWSAIFEHIFEKCAPHSTTGYDGNPVQKSKAYPLIKIIWTDFFSLSLDNLDSKYHKVTESIKTRYEGLEWYEKYDFVDTVLNFSNSARVIDIRKLEKRLNGILENENAAYQIQNSKVIPRFEPIEVSEINEAKKSLPRESNVRISLEKSLIFFSARPKPDFENSIKESISAIESLSCTILDKSGTLGSQTQELGKKLKIPPAIGKIISTLYGWTSDATGVRHGGKDKMIADLGPEARLVLLTSHALVNYITTKEEIVGKASK